ncbi:hypothetical protein ACFC1T_09225 [Kitasatospora sp. NPDC056076]|uniref:hypothetical protein n=1 Tax=Kitasatospora sp. NPDC056076 TaxID=3345703 RepID=UPI0035DD09AD
MSHAERTGAERAALADLILRSTEPFAPAVLRFNFLRHHCAVCSELAFECAELVIGDDGLYGAPAA